MHGGGSNFGGVSFPFLREKLAGNINPTIRCVEPAACPTLTKGEYRYDFGDTAGLTPLMKMHTLGHQFIPSPFTLADQIPWLPLVSHVYDLGLIEATSVRKLPALRLPFNLRDLRASYQHPNLPTQ